MAPSDKDAERRRRVRRSAIIVGLIALFFYLGMIALSIYRGTRPGARHAGRPAPTAPR